MRFCSPSQMCMWLLTVNGNGCGLYRIGRANDSMHAEIYFYGRPLTNNIKISMNILSYAVGMQKSILYPHSSKHASSLEHLRCHFSNVSDHAQTPTQYPQACQACVILINRIFWLTPMEFWQHILSSCQVCDWDSIYYRTNCAVHIEHCTEVIVAQW